MYERKLNLLVSHGFLAALLLLLLNDFALKVLFHNWLTGKLSDFVGLFIFPIFWSALFPRFKRLIYLLTASIFIFWKSAYSQPLIDFCNHWLSIPISRTVDLTDIFALLVLPVSYLYINIERKTSLHEFAPYLISCLSLFAFTATSYSYHVSYSGREYAFTESKAVLVAKAMRIDEKDETFELRGKYPHKPDDNPSNEFYINIRPDFCSDANAIVEIEDKSAGSVLILKEISYGDYCHKVKDDEGRLLSIFERDFISKMRAPEPPPNSGLKPALK